MDDLSGLNWSASSNTKPSKPPTGSGNYYTSFQSSPSPAISGRNTPLSAQGSGFPKAVGAVIPKSSTPDSFSNLVSFGSAKQTTLTLQEQQEKLQAERARREAEQRKQYNAQFGDATFWDGLGSKQQSLGTQPQSSATASGSRASSLNPFSKSHSEATTSNGNDDDLFAAFNKDTVVDKSSHYPPPSSVPASRNGTPLQNQELNLRNPQAWEQPSSATSGILGDDDDPFGLGTLPGRKADTGVVQNKPEEDDDFLGDLGRPVEEVRRQPTKTPDVQIPANDVGDEQSESNDPWDKAVDELVDMGFTAENSRRALTESGAGLDIQAAVGWLLNDAHRQAKEKSQSRVSPARQVHNSSTGSRGNHRAESGNRSRNDSLPAWMREDGRGRSQPQRDDSRSPANSDGDITKTAAAVGNNLLKTANSLWKTSQKKVQRAVADFQQDADLTQPKWMRPTAPDRDQRIESRATSSNDRSQQRRETASPSVTDEAMMLEADSRPPVRKAGSVAEPRSSASINHAGRNQSPTPSSPSTGRSTPIPRWQQSAPAPGLDAKSRLSKQAIEEQSAQAYVSPARRKKATPVPGAAPEPDLLSLNSNTRTTPLPSQSTPQASLATKISATPKTPTPIPVRPRAPTRNIPNLSPAALATSTQHRLAGTTHFKRGDYASAHSSYSSSLSALPQGHPITIILLCNRSLTALKTGEPKSAVTDADTALELIGVSRGENETIDLQGNAAGEGRKDMKEFFGKALTRKAEALEQMERWGDAAAVWKQAVEAGVGGSAAAQGRQRCEKARQPKPKATARPPSKAAPKPRPSAMSDLSPASQQSTEAVNRLRAANAAAEKADDEKFALADSVDARLIKWREGRRDNLRALLGGMDQVLWEGSGWKKIGMHDLVMNGKVKINYMKAIAKVHPDKLPQNATTEQQMISAAVFSTLNEAWDKFKTENGM